MGLSALDARVGTIVDHTFKRREDRKLVPLDTRRTGIIVKVSGEGSDSVEHIMVKFKVDEEPEEIRGDELVKVFPATSRVAREAYRRIMGLPKYVGREYEVKKTHVRAKTVDSMGIRPKPQGGLVQPEYGSEAEESEIGGMDLENTGA